MKSVLGMCLDWRVLTGLGAVGVGVWLLAPQYVVGALPVLLVLACPLSMILMAVMMRGSMGADTKMMPADRLTKLEAEHARLASEIVQTRAELAGSPSTLSAPREARS